MKKLLYLLCFLLSGLIVYAQNGVVQQQKFPQAKPKLKEQDNFTSLKNTQNQLKVPGTVHYSEDFGSGGPLNQLPAGWTAQNNTGTANNWIWSNSAPGGQYSTNVAALNSTTSSNGFLSLPSGFFNTPAPPGGFQGMDATVSSPMITLNPIVTDYILEWEQSMRYCCSTADELVVELSNDGVNWDVYDATGGRSPNTATPNAETVRIVVSATIGGQSSAYIRFRQTGASHYYWMIDDLKLIEGSPNLVLTSDYRYVFGPSSNTYNPIYTQVPMHMMPDLNVSVEAFNAGSQTQSMLTFHAKVTHDSTLSSQPLIGAVLAQDSSLTSVNTQAYSRIRDTLSFTPLNQTGYMSIETYFQSVSFNRPSPANTDLYQFIVTDSVLARDKGQFVGGAGPSSYQGGGNDGDRWGILTSMGSQAGTVTSLSIYVANDSSIVGSAILPKIWKFDQSQNTLSAVLANVQIEGLIPTTITSAMLGSWIRLPFTFSVGSPVLQADSQYVMGWEQTSGASTGNNFLAGRDRSMEPLSPVVTNFVYVNDATPSWGWVTQVAGVRANFVPVTVGIEESDLSSQIALYPNPTNGLVQVGLPKGNFNRIEVYDLKGKVVLTQTISPNRKQVSLDLSHLNKAVYLLKVSGEKTQVMKKLILH